MKNSHLTLLFIMLLTKNMVITKKIERKVSVDLVEERINGKLFSSRIDVTNGSLKGSWSIDGKQVQEDLFKETRKEEIIKELEIEESLQNQKRLEELRFKQEQQILVTKKIIKSLVITIEKNIAQFKDQNLVNYIKYSHDTIPSEIEFSALSVQKLEQARHLATTTNTEFSCDEGDKMIAILEDYPAKLQKLFQQTVKYAIEQCTDTQQLKKLLDIIL